MAKKRRGYSGAERKEARTRMTKTTTKHRKKTRQAHQKSISQKKAPKAAALKTRKEPAGSTAKQATKSGQILALLQRPAGATLKALIAATGWQAHSLRGFISGQLIKKMGLQVKSIRRHGERVYAASRLRRGSNRLIL